jgi:hypothetical protein
MFKASWKIEKKVGKPRLKGLGDAENDSQELLLREVQSRGVSKHL